MLRNCIAALHYKLHIFIYIVCNSTPFPYLFTDFLPLIFPLFRFMVSCKKKPPLLRKDWKASRPNEVKNSSANIVLVTSDHRATFRILSSSKSPNFIETKFEKKNKKNYIFKVTTGWFKKTLCTWRLYWNHKVHRDFLITLYFVILGGQNVNLHWYATWKLDYF